MSYYDDGRETKRKKWSGLGARDENGRFCNLHLYKSTNIMHVHKTVSTYTLCMDFTTIKRFTFTGGMLEERYMYNVYNL